MNVTIDHSLHPSLFGGFNARIEKVVGRFDVHGARKSSENAAPVCLAAPSWERLSEGAFLSR